MKTLIREIGKYIRFDVDEEVLKKHKEDRSYTHKELFAMNYKKDYFNEKVHEWFFNKNRNMNTCLPICSGNGDDSANESGFFSNVDSLEQIHENFLSMKVKRDERRNEGECGNIFTLNDKKVRIGVVKRNKNITQQHNIMVNKVNDDTNHNNNEAKINERFYALYERRKLLLNKYNTNHKHINTNNSSSINTSHENDDEHVSTDISITENEQHDNSSLISNSFSALNKHNKSLFLSTRNNSKLFTSFLINTNRKLMKQ